MASNGGDQYPLRKMSTLQELYTQRDLLRASHEREIYHMNEKIQSALRLDEIEEQIGHLQEEASRLRATLMVTQTQSATSQRPLSNPGVSDRRRRLLNRLSNT